jgi:hypothetical protein
VYSKTYYSYYGASTKYYGYRTSYVTYTYRYGSYFPTYKKTYGNFRKTAKVCMNSYDAKNYKICPKPITTTYVKTSTSSSAGGAAGGSIGGLCCLGCVGVAVWYFCCR